VADEEDRWLQVPKPDPPGMVMGRRWESSGDRHSPARYVYRAERRGEECTGWIYSSFGQGAEKARLRAGRDGEGRGREGEGKGKGRGRDCGVFYCAVYIRPERRAHTTPPPLRVDARQLGEWRAGWGASRAEQAHQFVVDGPTPGSALSTVSLRSQMESPRQGERAKERKGKEEDRKKRNPSVSANTTCV